MPITLNRKVRFTHPDFTYSGTDYTEFLFGSVGLKVNAEIIFEVAWGTEDVAMEFLAADDSIQRTDGGSFLSDGFRDGDEIIITGTASNNMSIASGLIIVTDEFIYIPGATIVNESAASATIDGTTEVTSMDFYPNLINNNTDFSLFNLTDRETMPKYYADSITTDSANPTVMIVGTNSHGWVTPADSATIYKSGLSTSTIQIFVINHTFTITPLFLANQLENVQKGIPPAAGSFRDADCLKYVYKIDAKFTPYDPDIVHTTEGNVIFAKGNTGWYNEFINGRPTVYTKSSIIYSENITNKGLSNVDYCKVVNVEATINSQGQFANRVCFGGTEDGQPCIGNGQNCADGGGFCQLVSLNTKFILHILHLPLNEEVYIDTATDYKTNFIYERAVVTSGSGAVQGENIGDYHFLKDVTATTLSTDQAEINFTIDFSSFLVDYFDTLDDTNRNYLIFVTVQNTEATDITSIDQTALILDVNKYTCDKDDASLFRIIDQEFFEYPNCNGCGYSNFNVLPMDTVLLKTQFHVKQGTEIDPIILKNISASLVAVRQNDVEEFPLESFTINTSGFLPNCENIQEISFQQERDFIIPNGDCRNEIQLFRMPTLDIVQQEYVIDDQGDATLQNVYYAAYELIYPFKVRWEEWRQLQGANRCFPTPTQNWRIYDNEGGWSIKFSIKAAVEKVDGDLSHTTDFEHITWGTIKDPCEMPYSVEFNTFDSTGVNSYEEVIARDAVTFVEATITGDFSGYTAAQLYGILTLDAWGVGGVAYSREIGTVINVDSDGVWNGGGDVLLATLTKVSDNTITLSAYLNNLYLPTDTNQFILSARIGLLTDCGSSSGGCMDELFIDYFTCGELQIIEVVDANTLVVSGEIVTQEERDVFVEALVLVFITPTTWSVTGGFIDGREIFDGTVGGNIISAPTHPYSDNNVGDTLQGDITGTLYSGTLCDGSEALRAFDDGELHLWDDGIQSAFE